MIKIRLTAFTVAFLMILGCVGCAKESHATPSNPAGRPTASIRDVSHITMPEEGMREVIIDIPAINYWTFNDLHDFLENPQRNNQQPFSPDDGQYLKLFEADGKTEITDWDTRLQSDMVVLQYDKTKKVICRLVINLKKDETDNSSFPSQILSVPQDTSSSATHESYPNGTSKPNQATASENQGTSVPLASQDSGSSKDPHTASQNTASSNEDSSRPTSAPNTSASAPNSGDSLNPSSKNSSLNASGPNAPSAGSHPGNSQVNSDAASTPAAHKTVITVCGAKQNKALQTAIDAFNKQSQTVEVVWWNKDITGIFTANHLEQSLEQNNCPDLILMNRTEMKTAIDRGLLLELSALGIDQMESMFYKASWEKTMFGNCRYGLPVGCVTACLACNDDILFRCEVDVPKSFDTLLSNAQIVAKWSNQSPPIEIITNPADSKGIAEQFIAMLWGYGGKFLNKNNTAAAFQSEAGMQVLETYQLLKDLNLIGSSYTTTDFANGNTAYGFVYSTEYSKIFGTSARANFTAAPLVMPGSKTVSPLDIYSYCIPATGTAGKPEAAYAFLRFYFSDTQYSVNECKAQDWIPAVTRGWEDEYYQTDEWKIFIDALENAKCLPALDFADTLYDYLSEAVLSVLSGEDKQQALTKAETKVNNRLSR